MLLALAALASAAPCTWTVPSVSGRATERVAVELFETPTATVSLTVSEDGTARAGMTWPLEIR